MVYKRVGLVCVRMGSPTVLATRTLTPLDHIINLDTHTKLKVPLN